MRYVLVICKEEEWPGARLLHSKQERPRLRDGKTVCRRPRQDADEAQFGDRAGCKLRRGQGLHPTGDPIVEDMMTESQGNKRIYIQQIRHGKLARISSTSLLLRVGASAPRVSTGSPVSGSAMIFA